MSEAVTLLNDLRCRGLKVTIAGPNLRIVPKPDADLVERLRAHKAEVMALLAEQAETERIAVLDAERHARDREPRRGYDYDASAPSHGEWLRRSPAAALIRTCREYNVALRVDPNGTRSSEPVLGDRSSANSRSTSTTSSRCSRADMRGVTPDGSTPENKSDFSQRRTAMQDELAETTPEAALEHPSTRALRRKSERDSVIEALGRLNRYLRLKVELGLLPPLLEQSDIDWSATLARLSRAITGALGGGAKPAPFVVAEDPEIQVEHLRTWQRARSQYFQWSEYSMRGLLKYLEQHPGSRVTPAYAHS